MSSLRNRILPLAGLALLVLLAIWIVLAPAETRLGNVVKLVYVHGALVWVGLLAFGLAGALGLVALVVRRPAWYRATQAAGTAALIIWVLYALSAMAVTGLTWGQWIAWGEPRVRASGLILIAAILLAVVSRLVNHGDFTAVVNAVLGVAAWIVTHQADVIRHPEDPIGGSNSTAIQGFYLLIVLTVTGLAAVWVAWLWLSAEIRAKQ